MAQCSVKDCREKGEYKPVLVLYAEGNNGTPAYASLNLPHCKQHVLSTTVKDLITDEGWEMIVSQFKNQGKIEPCRKRTQLQFIHY